jgi:hypothetical protein
MASLTDAWLTGFTDGWMNEWMKREYSHSANGLVQKETDGRKIR